MFNNPYRLVLPFILNMTEIKEKNKKKLEEIRKEWENSKNYPRKKKKRVRKRLLVEYSIFSWDPFAPPKEPPRPNKNGKATRKKYMRERNNEI